MRTKRQSGTSNQLPSILPYPKLLPFDNTPSINNLFCYVIEHYGTEGLSVLIYRQPQDDQVVVMCGDWEGNRLDIQTDKQTKLTETANKFINEDLTKFINLMCGIGHNQAQLFFAFTDDELTLVDVQVAQNKLVGPGMIKDIFGKICKTQKIKKIEIIDERAIERLEMKTGSYGGSIILKPSRFRMHHDPEKNTYQPLYVEVV